MITQTLTAVAALALGSMIVWFRGVDRRSIGKLGGGLLLVCVLTVVLATPLRERLVQKVERAEVAGLNYVLTGRLDAWQVALRILEDHPLGAGQGTYRALYVPTKLQLLDEGETFYRGHIYPTFSQAHNELLQAGAEWGWPGLALLGWILILLVHRLRYRVSTTDQTILWGGLGALTVLSLAHFPFHLALTGYPALLFLALSFKSEREPCEE